MFKNLRILIVEHLGAIFVTIFVILALYYICTQLIFKAEDTTQVVSNITNVLDKSTSAEYDNKIISGSQVLVTINNYYNKSDVMILLLNNPKDYDKSSYRFWVTGRGGKYGENTNYESVIISNNYENVTSLLIEEKSINNKYNKKALETYTNSNEKNYINVASNYKSVLLKCNGYIVGMAFLAI